MESSSEEMPVSRKRHHSRSRSKSPSTKNDEQDLKRKKVDTEQDITEKDTTNDGTTSSTNERKSSETEQSIEKSASIQGSKEDKRRKQPENDEELELKTLANGNEGQSQEGIENSVQLEDDSNKNRNEEGSNEALVDEERIITKRNNEINDNESKTEDNSDPDSVKEGDEEDEKRNDSITLSSDSNESTDNKEKVLISSGSNTPTKKLKQDTPNKKLTPKQLQKRLEMEKKLQEKQREREEKIKKQLEEKLKRKEMKDKELNQKQKEKEMKKKEELEQKQKEKEMRQKEKEEKEEKKRREREEKEQKRKEKEEKEEQKRKEREEEKQKKLQEIEEKNREKLKEEEKKQKAAAAFVNFFVPKKPDDTQDAKKTQTSNFLQFEVKSDMKLPPHRRDFLSNAQKDQLEAYLETQNTEASYLKDLASGKPIGKSLKTWPYEESTDDDVIIVDLGETICGDASIVQRHKAKFLCFHENRRPAYYGTWRKKSKFVKPRKPLVEDKEIINYEEDSDDDWEEEEQGESLNGSEDEADKENEDEKDDYEVDNDFFVPHGHLSDDEVDDEETTRLSPDSLKQKLRLLKEEFDQDMQSKTHKLKPRAIGCIWYNKDGSNVEEAVDRYLQPLAIITRCQIVIKSRIDIFVVKERKNKVSKELDPELIPSFLKIVHGSSNKKSFLVEQFLTNMESTGNGSTVSKGMLIRALRKCASWEKYRDEDAKRYKFRWYVHQELRDKYDLGMEVDSQ